MKPRTKSLGTKNIVGANVCKLRKLHNMSQKELAIGMQLKGVDINYTSLSKLEGQTRVATDIETYAIAQIFDIKVDGLFRSI